MRDDVEIDLTHTFSAVELEEIILETLSAKPMTFHDLLKTVRDKTNASVSHVRLRRILGKLIAKREVSWYVKGRKKYYFASVPRNNRGNTH